MSLCVIGGMKGTKVSHLKSRAGCNTCKRRRVKCDEAKPFCKRCLSSHRVCEGYGIIIKPSKQHASDDVLDQDSRNGASILLPKPAAAISPMPSLSRAQQHSFAFTESHAVAVTHGLRSLSFWRNVILPACHQEPSVLHAVLALVHAGHHRSVDARGSSSDGRKEHLRMLMEYNCAIQSLIKRQVDDRDDAHPVRVILITCILFTALELRTGRVTQAMKHLDEGRKLFLSLGTHLSSSGHEEDHYPQLILPSRPQSIEEELLVIFADLDIQATWFGCSRPQWKLIPHHSRLQQLTSGVMVSLTGSPGDVGSMYEAHQRLTILFNEVLKLTGQQLNFEQHTILNQVTNLRRDHLVARLNQWRDSFERLCLGSISGDSTKEPWKRHAALMLIHHAWLTIFLSVSYWEVKETDYDGYGRHFRTIVDLAATVLPENQVQSQPFSLEFGLILPLWMTAMKCRHPRVRREALHLLGRAGNEGLWDASLVTLLAEETIKIEEEIDQVKSDDHATSPLLLSQLVPLQRRISGVEVDREGEDSPMLVARFQQRLWTQHGSYFGEDRIVKRLLYPSDNA